MGPMADSDDLRTQANMVLSPVFELLDKGVAPYLKTIRSNGSYSYSPEKGLIIIKGRMIIKEIPLNEKKMTEDFWSNIEKWMEEKMSGFMTPF